MLAADSPADGVAESDLLVMAGYDKTSWFPTSIGEPFLFGQSAPKTISISGSMSPAGIETPKNRMGPQFMDGITNLKLIEPAMRRWQRDKEIEQWKVRFQALQDLPPPSPASRLELRLAIFPDEARLQWRLDSKGNFADFKQTQAKTFASRFDAAPS